MQSLATFEEEEAVVHVDTSLIAVDQQPSRMGGLYSVMGELDLPCTSQDDPASPLREPLVRARLVRAVDGLDLNLWAMALKVKRQYDLRAPVRDASEHGEAARPDSWPRFALR